MGSRNLSIFRNLSSQTEEFSSWMSAVSDRTMAWPRPTGGRRLSASLQVSEPQLSIGQLTVGRLSDWLTAERLDTLRGWFDEGFWCCSPPVCRATWKPATCKLTLGLSRSTSRHYPRISRGSQVQLARARTPDRDGPRQRQHRTKWPQPEGVDIASAAAGTVRRRLPAVPCRARQPHQPRADHAGCDRLTRCRQRLALRGLAAR